MKNQKVKFIVQLALLVAVEVIFKLIGLGSVPVGPLYMSFLTVPIAIGAILLGPYAGMILGGVFGIVSFKDAMTGVSVMTSTFLSISVIHTFILCVVTRMIMGLCVGYVFKVFDHFTDKSYKYVIASLSAPLLNTLFFMGYICLFFYQTEYIQSIAAGLNATNPLMFVVLLVGMQGLIEAVVCAIVGGAISKVLARFVD